MDIFSHIFAVKIVLIVWKNEINEKEAREGPILKMNVARKQCQSKIKEEPRLTLRQEALGRTGWRWFNGSTFYFAAISAVVFIELW